MNFFVIDALFAIIIIILDYVKFVYKLFDVNLLSKNCDVSQRRGFGVLGFWGYTYANRNLTQARQFNGIPYNNGSGKKQEWIDSTITIANGTVVATPTENSNLICLDLLTGKPRWKPVPRTGDL